MPTNVLNEYLVKLGAFVDAPQWQNWNAQLTRASSQVENSTSGMLKSFLKFEFGVTGALGAIAGGVIALTDKVAQEDMQFKLLGMRMYMSRESFKTMQMSLEALGYSLQDLWNPEAHDRFLQLVQDMQKLQTGLGPNFENTMIRIRDLRMEFSRLGVVMQVGLQGFVAQLFEKIGGSQWTDHFSKWIDQLIERLPALVNELSTDFAPVLKDIMIVGKEVWMILENLAAMVIRLTGALMGDQALANGALSMENLAKATDEWAQALIKVFSWINRFIEMLTAHPVIASMLLGGIAGGAAGAAAMPMVGGVASLIGGLPFGLAAAGLSPIVGTGLGILGGLGLGLGGEIRQGSKSSSSLDMSDIARGAAQVSANTGIPAHLIMSQLALESGGFKSQVALNKNNLGGIRTPGSTDYKSYNSIADFFADYEKVVTSSRYTNQGILTAQTPADYAAALKRGGYYESSYSDYERGMSRWDKQLASSGYTQTVNMGGITVNITHPGATKEEIQAAVTVGARNAVRRQNQHMSFELGGVFG